MKRLCSRLIVVVLALFCSMALPAHAATLFVNGNDGSNGNDCSSSAEACATVQRAIDRAGAGDTIQIADASYTELLEIDKTLTLQGQSRAGTILQADAEPFQFEFDAAINQKRVISVSGGSQITLRDLTVRHGVAVLGGGIRVDGQDLVIERVHFDRNGVGDTGGAIRAENNSITIMGSLFTGNLAGQAPGVDAGGAIYARSSSLTVADSSFEANRAGSGGAVFLRDVDGDFQRVRFVGNESEGAGGGLTVRDGFQAMLDVAFIGNSAVGSGGGVYALFDASYQMTNVLFSGNYADSSGGGIFNQRAGSSLPRVLTNVTFSGNRAEVRGGGIWKPGNTEFRNTVIWNNSDSNGVGGQSATMSDFSSSSIIGVNNSLLQAYPADEFPGSNNLDGTDPANNPLFRDAVNPIGAPSLAGDLRLQFESPVRDVGNNGFVTGITTDLDGKPRIVGGTVDLGAFEGDDLLFSDGFEDTDLIP